MKLIELPIAYVVFSDSGGAAEHTIKGWIDPSAVEGVYERPEPDRAHLVMKSGEGRIIAMPPHDLVLLLSGA